MVERGIRRERDIEQPDDRRDFFVWQRAGEDRLVAQAALYQPALQRLAQRPVAGDDELGAGMFRRHARENFRERFDPVPGPESTDKPQHRTFAQAEAGTQRSLGRSRMKQLCVHAIRHDVNLVRVDAEVEDVSAERSGNGEHRIGLPERPALSLRAKITQAVAAIGGLLDGERRIDLNEQRNAERLRDDGAGGAIERGAFVDEVWRILVEPGGELGFEFLVVENAAQFAGQRAVETELLREVAHVLRRSLRAGREADVEDVGLDFGGLFPRRLVEHGCGEYDLMSGARERADHFAHMDRSALAAKHGNPGIGAQVENLHECASAGTGAACCSDTFCSRESAA